MKIAEIIHLVHGKKVAGTMKHLLENGYEGNKSSLYTKIKSTQEKYQTFMKARKREETLSKFLDQDFECPMPLQTPRKKTTKTGYSGLLESEELECVQKANIMWNSNSFSGGKAPLPLGLPGLLDMSRKAGLGKGVGGEGGVNIFTSWCPYNHKIAYISNLCLSWIPQSPLF